MWDTERRIYWGWGTEGTLQAFTIWLEKPRTGDRPNEGALWLARAEAEFLLDRRDAAAEDLVKAVLAMEREKVQFVEGEPRLAGFAGRPNASPYGVDDTAVPMRASGDWDDGASGCAVWGGGSVLVWEGDGEKFFAFVLEVAADDVHPEQAMAATIWAHAVVLRRYGRYFPHLMPPAALRFLKSGNLPAVPPEDADSSWWSRAFEDAIGAALDREDPTATRLRGWRERMWASRPPGGKSRPVSDGTATILWSLEDEFRARFSSVDTLRAGDLRALSEFLLK